MMIFEVVSIMLVSAGSWGRFPPCGWVIISGGRFIALRWGLGFMIWLVFIWVSCFMKLFVYTRKAPFRECSPCCLSIGTFVNRFSVLQKCQFQALVGLSACWFLSSKTSVLTLILASTCPIPVIFYFQSQAKWFSSYTRQPPGLRQSISIVKMHTPDSQ